MAVTDVHVDDAGDDESRDDGRSACRPLVLALYLTIAIVLVVGCCLWSDRAVARECAAVVGAAVTALSS